MSVAVQVERFAEALKRGNDLWRADDFAGMLAHYQALGTFFEDAPPAYRRHYFGNLAIAYQDSGQWKQAVPEYLKALQVCGEEDESDIATINANLASCHLLLGHADETLIYLSQPEDFHRRNVPSDPEAKKEWAFRLGNALETKARALLALNDRSAIEAAREAANLLLEYWIDAPGK